MPLATTPGPLSAPNAIGDSGTDKAVKVLQVLSGKPRGLRLRGSRAKPKRPSSAPDRLLFARVIDPDRLDDRISDDVMCCPANCVNRMLYLSLAVQDWGHFGLRASTERVMEDTHRKELVCPVCGRPRPSSLVQTFGAMLRARAENRCWISDGSCKDRGNQPHIAAAGVSHSEVSKTDNVLRHYVAQTIHKRALLGC